jgi:hypothetical protein
VNKDKRKDRGCYCAPVLGYTLGYALGSKRFAQRLTTLNIQVFFPSSPEASVAFILTVCPP